MKKSVIYSVIMATTLATSFSTFNPNLIAHAEEMSQLTTSDKEIQKDGQNYQLKGVNAGNAYTTEGYLGGITSDRYKNYSKPYEHMTYKELKEALDDQYGSDEAKKKLNIYANNHWTNQDFQNVKDMGMNTIRLPLNYINLTNYKKGMDPDDVKVTDHSFDAVDKFVEKAKAHGIYVILDFHGAPNSQNGTEHSADTNKGSGYGYFWDDTKAQDKAMNILNQMAEHYKNETAVAGYDILNEPKGVDDGKSDEQVNVFYKEAVKSIRETGDKHIIFLEAVWDPENLKAPSYYNDSANQLVYEYHNYATSEDDSVKQSFNNKLNKIEESNYSVPTYIGEFNVESMKDGPSSENDDLKYILNKINKDNLSWTFWNYDVQGDGNWGAYKYDSINENPESEDFGKKSGEAPNEPNYSYLKEATK